MTTATSNSIKSLKKSDLSKDNANNIFINQQGPGMILFFAKWCGHCKTFGPVYQQLNSIINKGGVNFPCLAIEDVEIPKIMNIEGFPTIKFFDEHGMIIKNSTYNGKRDLESLLSTICSSYGKCSNKN